MAAQKLMSLFWNLAGFSEKPMETIEKTNHLTLRKPYFLKRSKIVNVFFELMK